MTDDIRQEFAAAAHIYSDRLKAEKEARENPGKTRRDNADAFSNYIEQQINEQSANGTRLDITNL